MNIYFVCMYMYIHIRLHIILIQILINVIKKPSYKTFHAQILLHICTCKRNTKISKTITYSTEIWFRNYFHRPSSLLTVKLQYLYTSIQLLMEDVSSSLHDLHIVSCRVSTLSICDWVDKSVAKLFACSQQIRFYKIDHAVIWNMKRCHQ